VIIQTLLQNYVKYLYENSNVTRVSYGSIDTSAGYQATDSYFEVKATMMRVLDGAEQKAVTGQFSPPAVRQLHTYFDIYLLYNVLCCYKDF